jgi:PAS domain S-box-containing protein
MSIFTIWSFIVVITMFIHQLQTAVYIADFMRGITTFTPALILYIVIRYTHYPKWFGNKQALFLFGITSLLALFSITEQLHHLSVHENSISYNLDKIPIHVFKAGKIFLLYFFHIFFCLFISLFILVRSLFHSGVFFKKQIIYIIAAIGIPAINDVFYWFGYSIFKDYHLITISFVIGNSFFALALFGHRFLRLAPVARSMVIDSINDIMLVTNTEHIIIDVNERFRQKFGLKNSLCIGKSVFEVLSHYTELIEVYKNNINKEITLQIEKQTFYYSTNVTSIEYSGEKELSKIVFLHDNTEIKQAEIKIKESEEKFHSIFNNLQTGLMLLNKEGKYIAINPGYNKITGYSEEEMKNKSIGLITHPDDKPKIKEAMNFVANPWQDGEYSEEYKLIKKNSELVWVLVYAKPYFNLQGEFEYVMVEFIDITNLKNNEIKLKEYSKKLEETNATKDKFFSIIAHDLRNPFNGLIGISQIILKNMDSMEKENLSRLIEMIHQTSKSGHKLLENLLEWSCIQTNTIKYYPQPIPLKNTSEGIIYDLNVSFENKNIFIINEINQETEVFADYNMLCAILRNLLSNACKFTNSNGQIRISATKNFENNEMEITISDNGVGIKEENLKKIFRIDSKVITKGTQNENGTGLGLILCKEFIEKNEGKIWIESKVNEGTKVSFTLPCMHSCPDEIKTEAVNESEIHLTPKYSLPTNQFQKMTEELLQLLLVEKLYTDPNLTLQKFANRMNTNRVYLSQVINEVFNQNFNNFINKYRIQESIKLLKDYKVNNLTIENIAVSTGFKNKVTFYAAFKKVTGKTPGEYISNP